MRACVHEAAKNVICSLRLYNPHLIVDFAETGLCLHCVVLDAAQAITVPCWMLPREAGTVFCFFADEPLDSDFRLFAALAGVACEKRESNYSKLYYSK